jgi:hypothetical protein
MSDRSGLPASYDADITREPEYNWDDEPPALAQVAESAAEAVRTLNLRTMAGKGEPEYPADVYEIIGNLKAMADRLPQLLGQLAAWLESEHQAGRIAHDSGREDPGVYVARVRDALIFGSDRAGNLADELRQAHNACSGLKSA